MKRLLIIGSREFIVGAMDFAITHAQGLSVLGMVDSASDVIEDVRQARPDTIVLDGVTDFPHAVACLPDLLAQAPNARLIIVVDQPEHEDVARALDAGAMVWAHPEIPMRPRDGRPGPRTAQLRSVTGPALGADRISPVLTKREHEIMQWVASGHTNAAIARSLWVTEQTVKFHLTNIYRKLGVANRTEATHYVVQHGLVSQSGRPEPAGDEVRPTTPEPIAHVPAVSG